MSIPVSFQGCIESGCITHCAGHRVMVTGKLPFLHGICARHPDTTTIRSTHTDDLSLPQISVSAGRFYILPSMKDRCLIYVGQLCDDRFSVNFNTNNVFLQKLNYALIGYRDATTSINLIDFDKPQPLPFVSNHAILPPSAPKPIPSNILVNYVHEISTKRDLVLYLHRSACIPVPSTWIQAIDVGFFATCPGLTSALICKNLPKIIHTAKGHLCKEQKNLRSIKKTYIYHDGARRSWYSWCPIPSRPCQNF